MAVSNTNSIDRYEGNGANPYSITFDFDDVATVFADIEDADGVITTLSNGSGMTVSTSPKQITTDTDYDSTHKVSVYRVIPYTQPTDLTPAGKVPVETIESALDRLAYQIQQVKDANNTVVRVQLTDDEIDPLPSASQRRNKVAAYADTDAAAPIAMTYATLEEKLAAVRDGSTSEPIVNRTASFTLASTLVGAFIQANSSSTIAVTLPDDDTIPNGGKFDICRAGTGAVNFIAGSGVTINSSVGATASIAVQHSAATVVKVDTATYRVFGDISAT